MQYYNYNCELDIFWDEIDSDNNIIKLVVELFFISNNQVINISEDLLLSDILKENYIENKMYQSIIDTIQYFVN